MRTPEEEELFKQGILGKWDQQNAWRLKETNQTRMHPLQEAAYLARQVKPKKKTIAAMIEAIK